ncbi:serine hydrolase domain-containing protein [Shewanella glacialimarina]|uniref:serine hydrolase domain-containing protein n=1 Tax=Shewanella glacialimarina TaxID=2590884 RepID=UPI001CF8BB0E|nr:serine hydrolase [Shewanella glacialimarina]UCX03643.1 serine hydrolase [Shewanella glacialimarina]
MSSVLKFIKGAALSTLVVIIIIVGFNWQSVNRLYSVITLFDDALIVDNFSHMNDIFFNQKINQHGEPSAFGVNLTPLPETFNYRNQTTHSNEFLTRRATTALLVLKDDNITYEQYFLGTQSDDKRISWSMAKSFVSILFGMQVDAGKIDIEKSVDFYLPELASSGYANVKVKHVLQMSSGVKWNEDYQDFYSDINKMGRVLAIGGSLDKMTSELVNQSQPGKVFRYVSMDTHVIGMITRRVSGKSLVELLQTTMWDKIGMQSDAYWLTDSQGSAFALGGLNLTTRDYARFGRLLLNNGAYNGQQIVSQAWIKAATTAQADYLQPQADKLGYGYQIWLPPGAEAGEFFCVGVYGQYIYVNQQHNVVIVKNSADLGFQDSLISKHETIEFFREIVASLK